MKRIAKPERSSWLLMGALTAFGFAPALAGPPIGGGNTTGTLTSAQQAATQPEATYESTVAEAQRKIKSSVQVSAMLFQEAARLTNDPSKKAYALGEASVLALRQQMYRTAIQTACEALDLVSGPARASHFYNLGRIALAVQDAGGAAAQFRESLALRPNATVSAQLGKLGAVAPTIYPGPDVGKGFCAVALGPVAPVDPEFVKLANQIASQRQEKVTRTERRPLGPRGELLPVAMLCDASNEKTHGGWLIEVKPQHRYLVAFDFLDGRASLDACEASYEQICVGRGPAVALVFVEGHHGGFEEYRVAVRDGRPVTIFTSDEIKPDTDFDKKGGSYKTLDEFARTILLDKVGMAKIAREDP